MKTVKYLLAFFFVFLAVSITGCSHLAKTSAEKAIKKDLDLLKNLDSETTMKYISYQELFPDSDDNTELSDDIKEVFSLFFQKRNQKNQCRKPEPPRTRMRFLPVKKAQIMMGILWSSVICISTNS